MSDFYLYPDGTSKPVTRGKPPKDAIRVKESDPRLTLARPALPAKVAPKLVSEVRITDSKPPNKVSYTPAEIVTVKAEYLRKKAEIKRKEEKEIAEAQFDKRIKERLAYLMANPPPSQEHMDKVSAVTEMEREEQEPLVIEVSTVSLTPDPTPLPLPKPIEAPKVEGYIVLDHKGVKRYTPEEFSKLTPIK
jgi:hypothetical protein